MSKYSADYPRYGFGVCHGCGSMAPHHSQQVLFDNGWTFNLNNFGYYGGFTDYHGDFTNPIGEELERIRFCHDCVLKFLETFPLLGMFISSGSHSMSGPDEKPCCKYAWKSESINNSSITYLATDDSESWEIM